MNKNEAKTENMKKNKQTIDKPFANAGSENMNVSINFCSPLNLLNILKSFVTLKTLKILAICGKIEIAEDVWDLAPA